MISIFASYLWKHKIPLIFVIFSIYAFSMVLFPIYHGNGDLGYVQKVWDRWQTLNASMIALIASGAVIYTSFRINETNQKRAVQKIEEERKYEKERLDEEQRRWFLAILPILPQILSDLTSYCQSSMALYSEVWERSSSPRNERSIPLENSVPPLPTSHTEVFRECIQSGEETVSLVIAYILRNLQIHHSRMSALPAELQSDNGVMSVRYNLIVYFYRVAEIQAWVNRLFSYSCGQDESFNASPLTYDDYSTAFLGGRVEIGNIVIRRGPDETDYDLRGFIERAIVRKDEDNND